MGSSKSQSVNQGSSSKSVTVDPSLTSFFIIASQVEEDDVCIKFFLSVLERSTRSISLKKPFLKFQKNSFKMLAIQLRSFTEIRYS